MQKQRFRLRNNFILNILFSFSSVTLALFGFLAVLPPASEPEASAIIDGEQFALTVTNSDSLSLNINPTDAGSIAIAKDTVTANTNSPAGYKLYVSTDSTTSNNIHLNGRESNNTEDKKLVATTGTNELPTTLENNSWGFAIAGAGNFDTTYNTENPSMSAKFAAVPQKDAEQLIHDHSGRATDDETEIYFAAKADTNIASGNYQTTILYTTLSEATDQDQTEINLDQTLFTDDSYINKVFTMSTSILSSKVLSEVEVKINNTPVENLTIAQQSPLTVTFTLPSNIAWGASYDINLSLPTIAKSYTLPNAIGIYKFMQDMNQELCNSMALEEQKQFVDIRDNKIYWAAKLKDGNCWMTQNLDYDLSVTANQTLTPETSNVVETRTLIPSTNSDLSNRIIYTEGGDQYETLPSDTLDSHYAVGDYYSWRAATAGQGTTKFNSGANTNISICPKGWRLPIGNSDSANYSFGKLLSQYENIGFDYDSGVSNHHYAPLYFISGNRVDGHSNNYWSSSSSSRGSSTYANAVALYSLIGSAPGIGINSTALRHDAYSIRCVASDEQPMLTVTIKDGLNDSLIGAYDFATSYTLPNAPSKQNYDFLGYTEDKNSTTPIYHAGDIIVEPLTLYAIYKRPLYNMQDVATWQNYINDGEQLQAKDSRDNKIYWVGKLSDGHIWMTQNLDYDLSITANQTLVPATSNVKTTRTVVPASNWGSDSAAIYYANGGDYYALNGGRQSGYSSLPADSINRHYAFGSNYSLLAATAGQGPTDSAWHSPDGISEATESICPAGWRLPAGGIKWQNIYEGFIGDKGAEDYAVSSLDYSLVKIALPNLEADLPSTLGLGMPTAVYILDDISNFYPASYSRILDTNSNVTEGLGAFYWTAQWTTTSSNSNGGTFVELVNNSYFVFPGYANGVVGLNVRCVAF